VSGTTHGLPAVEAHSLSGKLAELQAHRQPVGLATEALGMVLSDCGAIAGSLVYALRPSLRVRLGTRSRALDVYLDRWESSVEQRIAAGPWRMSGQDGLPAAWQPIEGTGQTAMCSLLLDGQQVAGALCLVFSRERVPTGDQRERLLHSVRAFGNTVSLIGELALTKQRLGQLSLFYQVAQVMASTFDLDKVLDHTLELATAILDASASALMTIDEAGSELVMAHAHGDAVDLPQERRAPLSEGPAGWVATHGEPLVVNNVPGDPSFGSAVDTWAGVPTRSMVCVPIQIRGKTIGVLQAINKRSRGGFDSEDLSLMVTTANQAAIAIENNKLYQSLRDEQERIIQAQENVRRQVARNLHDGTVQFLSAIAMSIDHLERLLELKPEAARSELQVLRDLTRQATRQARLALFELRPLILETQGLLPALEAYVQQLQDSEEFAVHLQVEEPLPQVSSSAAATVFAIVQEAVNNAKKHASPQDVWLCLSQKDGCLDVVVEDNGKGFDFPAVEQEYDRRRSIGLLSMKERADLIDGRVEVQSSTTPPKAGTRVILHVPLCAEGDQAATKQTTQ
jgi:signal transduction histidine kinase